MNIKQTVHRTAVSFSIYLFDEISNLRTSLRKLTNFLKTHTICVYTHVALEFVRLKRNLYVSTVAWFRDVDVLQVSSLTETR